MLKFFFIQLIIKCNKLIKMGNMGFGENKAEFGEK